MISLVDLQIFQQSYFFSVVNNATTLIQIGHVVLCMMCVCLAECELWTREEGVASSNGMLYPYTLLSKCLNLCLELSTCLAVDFSVSVCVVHTNIVDITTKVNASGFTQYTLDRACLPPTSTSTLSTFRAVRSETSTQSFYFGK